MFYVIQSSLSASEAIAQGVYAEFSVLDDAKAHAEGLKKETGKQYSIFKVEWVTTTQTLGELKRYPSIQGPMGWVD
jgi:hypothetical protein